MMKITKKRIVSLLLASLMLMSVFGTLTANAASKVEFESKSGIQYLKSNGKASTSYLFIYGADLATQVQNVRSSNPKVATATVKDISGVCLYIKAIKTGTTTISCTVKGKALKYKLTVCKYVNPFKQLMIGDQDYASKFNKQRDELIVKSSGAPVTLTVTPKAGWKLKKIMGDVVGKKKDVKIKNGETIDPNKYIEIKFTFQKKKVTEELALMFDTEDIE